MNTPLTPSGFFVLRTPLLAYEELATPDLDAPLVGGSSLDQAVASDRKRLRRKLKSLLDRPEVREALYLASPDLEASLPMWQRDPDGDRGRGVERALWRYLARASSRPTPFGLFAGISVGATGGRTRFVLGPLAQYCRHSRPDTGVLGALLGAVIASPELGADLPLVPNPVLYHAAGSVRWVRSAGGATTLMRAAVTPLLHLALAEAEGGATAAHLLKALNGSAPVAEGATDYVDELVRSQLLVPSIDIVITGTEPLQRLADDLDTCPSSASAAKSLRAMADGLADLDGAGLGRAPVHYRLLSKHLDALTPTPNRVPFHVDLVKPANDLTLGSRVLDEIARAVALLHRFSREPQPSDLDRFCEDFGHRYATREVPLLEAVDHEAGIGFGAPTAAAPLLEGLSPTPAPAPSAPATKSEETLLELLLAAAVRHAREVVLQPGQIDALCDGGPALPLPGAFTVVAAVEAEGDDALDAGEFSVLIRSVGGPSGAWLFGRFCHAEPALREHVERHLRTEEASDPDAVWAEIVYHPTGPFDNVVLRPVLRDYEIPCLGVSGASPDRQIQLSDLHLSLVGGRLVVRSQRLNRRVEPRCTTAHDFATDGPPAYRLLASLQTQGVSAGLSWSWGTFGRATFLPRVRHGRIVLSLARWRIGADELADFRAMEGAGLLRRLRAWRKNRDIPRIVSLVDRDGALPVDFENVLSTESFVHLVRGRPEAILEEIFPAPERLSARGPEGHFFSEVVVPFVGPTSPRAPGVRATPASAVLRRFPPGSEWTSAKLYAGPATSDGFLRDVVEPLRRRLLDEGVIDQWFFVRYSDPHWHLRLRFHAAAEGDPAMLSASIVDALGAAVRTDLAWRLQLDTYDREVERYGGGEGIELAERLFTADSDAVIEALTLLAPGDEGAEGRGQLALCSVDQLLDDLSPGADGKLAILQRGRAIYAWEHKVDADFEARLSRRFRARRAALDEILDGSSAEGSMGGCLELLRQRSRRLTPLAVELGSLEASQRLCTDVVDLALSYVHLDLNRLLTSAHRAQELVIYDTLLRVHRSRMARGLVT